MKLHYYKDKVGNFGDDLNRWLWSKVIPIEFDNNDEQIVIGIGTLLNSKLNTRLPTDSIKIIMGSGAGYGENLTLDDNWKIYFVRGPLTAELLGIDESMAITDPAVLVKNIDFYSYGRQYEVAIMPHHVSCKGIDWVEVCANLNIKYINPSYSVEKVLDIISRTNLLITEAMHGAIVADALRVPWVPIKMFDHIFDFKWHDWTKTIGVQYTPQYIFDELFTVKEKSRWDVLSRLNALKKRKQGEEIEGISKSLQKVIDTENYILSNESKLNEVHERCMESVNEFIKDTKRVIT